eukprot:1195059-Prorocentrum_minimum.AAC.3
MALSPAQDLLYVFHRGERIWDGGSFTFGDRITYNEPAAGAAIAAFDPSTGEKRSEFGAHTRYTRTHYTRGAYPLHPRSVPITPEERTHCTRGAYPLHPRSVSVTPEERTRYTRGTYPLHPRSVPITPEERTHNTRGTYPLHPRNAQASTHQETQLQPKRGVVSVCVYVCRSRHVLYATRADSRQRARGPVGDGLRVASSVQVLAGGGAAAGTCAARYTNPDVASTHIAPEKSHPASFGEYYTKSWAEAGAGQRTRPLLQAHPRGGGGRRLLLRGRWLLQQRWVTILYNRGG